MSLLLVGMAAATVAADPVFLSNVRATTSADAMVLEIEGEGALDAEAVSARSDRGGLFVRVDGGRARASRRSWGEGATEIRAHRHSGWVELTAPWPDTGACAGTAAVSALSDGRVRVSVPCRGVAALPSQARAAETVVSHRSAKTALPRAKAEDELRKELALAEAPPAPPVEPAPAAPEPSAQPAVAAHPSEPPVAPAKPIPPQTPVAIAKPTPPPAVIPTPPAATPAVTSESPTHAASGWGAMVPPLLGLTAIGGVGAWMSRRRKRRDGRLVQILESTSLGPKRSLIVARVGSETLLLGASEAGISLLQAQPDRQPESETRDDDGIEAPSDRPALAQTKARTAAVASSVAAADEALQSLNLTAANKPDEEAGQVSLLARLFGGQRKGISADWPFDDVLRESVEDQELRAKLAGGLKVSTR